jgi:hypothetical protein
MKNWKTTACGCGIAALQAMQAYAGHQGWKGYAAAALIAAFGVACKDFNVSGVPTLRFPEE